MFLPIKTNDLVVLDGAKFMVNQVQLTGQGAILEIYPVKATPRIVHASEVRLADRNETVRRAKSVGIKALKSTGQHYLSGERAIAPITDENTVQIALPDNLSDTKKQEITKALLKTLSESLSEPT